MEWSTWIGCTSRLPTLNLSPVLKVSILWPSSGEPLDSLYAWCIRAVVSPQYIGIFGSVNLILPKWS